MGEEVKKPEEEKKAEEAKPKSAEEEKPKAAEEGEKPKAEEGEKAKAEEGEKKKEGEGEAAPPPPPPEEIEMRVFMHCDGCARKVKRSLKGFEGVEEVKTDCRTHKVVVKGKKAAEDPMKVVERVQKKTGRKVELLTPLPPPKPEKEEEKKEEEKPKVEEKKEEPPVIAVVLKVHMHCEACAQEIKKRILKMKGVQSAEPDLKASQVTVKGVFDPAKLVEYVYKRTGKHAAVVKSEPVEKKPEEEKPKEGEGAKDEKKAEGEEKAAKADDGENKENKDGGASEAAAAAEGGKVELKKDDYIYTYFPRYMDMMMYPPQMAYPSHGPFPAAVLNPPSAVAYPPPLVVYPPPPQIFSDENPNACSVM